MANNSFGIVPTLENIDYYLSFHMTQSGTTNNQLVDSRLRYNPVTGVLTVPNIQLQNKLLDVATTRSVITYVDSTSTQTLAAGYHQAINRMTATITPSSIASKILITVRWHGEFSDDSAVANTMWGLQRNGGQIGSPLNPGSRRNGITTAVVTYVTAENSSTTEALHFSYLDSPNTATAVTYQLTCWPISAITLYHNRTSADVDSSAYERGTSCITLVEV